MHESQLHLLRTRRFLPLFVTLFLGAGNDNLFKNAIAVLVLYRIAEQASYNGEVLVTVAAGIFMLPFFLFSATGGQLADKLDKAILIRVIKAAEVIIMGLGAVALFAGDVYFMLGVLFLMGTQSAFFGPVKYSILPVHLHEDELIGGNAFLEAGTFTAILLGTIAGGLLVLTDDGIAVISMGIVGLAVIGLAASFSIPRTQALEPGLAINPNLLGETWATIRRATKERTIFLSILGISWFWLVGATLLAQFPNLAKSVFNADNYVVTLLLVVATLGIALGSLLCNTLLKGEISAKYVPFAAFGMSIFLFDLYLACPEPGAAAGPLIGIGVFLESAGNWRVLFDIFAVTVCGGIFTVPLYAILQSRGDKAELSRVIAGNNILNALFMVVGAAVAAVMLGLDFTVPQLVLVMAAVNGVVTIYICGLLPDAVVKAFLISLLKLCYRVEVRGLENYAKAGKRAVVVVNHVSFLDAVLLAVFLPVKPMFAIDTRVAEKWWIKAFLRLVDVFPMDPTNPMATKSLIKAVREDRHCVIFPEGRLTVTGALMKVYEGPGMIADKSQAMLVPVRIDGMQYTPFSRLRGKVRIRWFPKVTITILPPQRFDIPANIVGRARRQLAGIKLYDIMSDMIFETCDRRQTLFEALLNARAVNGRKQLIAEDIERHAMDYGRFILGSRVLGRKLTPSTEKGEYVGVMLPNSVGAVMAFFALQAFGRVPAMLNFSTGTKNMIAALKAAEIKTVLTSRRFAEMAQMTETIESLGAHAEIVYLEDLKDKISFSDKAWGAISGPFARSIHKRLRIGPDDPAVVLFTSGSEGTPKGVVLSHANLLANRYQLAARIDFNPTDIVFNALPIFHSFGLTGGTLLPMLSGVKTFLYPSPLHYRMVPALVYDTNATILFGTDTFLAGYARVAHPYDFYSVRYVFAGAEKVKEETRQTWADKFGLRILEGYGTTETSPILSTNTPLHYKPGTVGRFMPGIEYDLEPVPGISEGGRLVVSGPNIMLGYLRAENPGVLEPPVDGRYDTGDIVSVDAEGFVTILGRVKRFAKIAGEMVSLTAVEGYANAVWPGHMHAVVSVPDARKGEQLVLVTDKPDADRDDLLSYAKDQGIAELMVPKAIHVVGEIPVLGTGKVDYVGIKALLR